MSRECPARSRLLRFIRHPAVLIVAALGLVVDFSLLPANAGAKKWLHRVERRFGVPWPDQLTLDVEFVVWRESGVLHVEQRSTLPDRDSMLGFVRVDAPLPTRGWWAPTVEQRGVFMPPFDQRAFWGNAEVRALVIDRVEHLPNPNAATYAQDLRDGLGREDRPIISGYVHNGIALLFASLLAIGLCCYVPPIVRWFVERRRAAAGQCPTCRYDLRGDLSRGCPECGWRRSDSDPPPSSPHDMLR